MNEHDHAPITESPLPSRPLLTAKPAQEPGSRYTFAPLPEGCSWNGVLSALLRQPLEELAAVCGRMAECAAEKEHCIMTAEESLQVEFVGNFHADGETFQQLVDLAKDLYEQNQKENALRVMNHWVVNGMGCSPCELADLDEWYESLITDNW
jgi:hypothetical protein